MDLLKLADLTGISVKPQILRLVPSGLVRNMLLKLYMNLKI